MVKLQAPSSKLQAPSSKLQAPKKLQVSNPRGVPGNSACLPPPNPCPAGEADRFGAWCLELLWNLELGIWSLVRSRSPPPTRPHRPKAATPKTPSPYQSKTLARQFPPPRFIVPMCDHKIVEALPEPQGRTSSPLRADGCNYDSSNAKDGAHPSSVALMPSADTSPSLLRRVDGVTRPAQPTGS